MQNQDELDPYNLDGHHPRRGHEPTPASTLLPSPIASVVSIVTRSSSLYLRLGTYVGGLALDGARITTLTGLEMSRAVLEAVLSRAGRDVVSRSTGELGRIDAEGLLERSIATLHSTITQISFAASTGFYVSAASLSSASDVSQQLLASLDSILGSTDSSRAIASIITLIRREFQNPATGAPGEKVGVADLLIGLCGLALLQKWGRRLTELETFENDSEDVVWDVVILDDGTRADVVSTSRGHPHRDKTSGMSSEVHTSPRSASFMTVTGDDDVLQTIRDIKPSEYDLVNGHQEADLKERIMQNLPPNASVSITTSTTTTKTITVEISGAEVSELVAPPGVEVVEEQVHHASDIDVDGEVLTKEQKAALRTPRYRVVYRTVRERLRGTNVDAKGEFEPTMQHNIPNMDNDASSLDEPSEVLPILDADETAAPVTGIEASTTATSSDSSIREKMRSTQVNYQAKTQSDLDPSATKSPKSVTPPNLKRPRKPLSPPSSSVSSSERPSGLTTHRGSEGTNPALKKTKSDVSTKSARKNEKRPSLRDALRKGSSTAISSLWHKEGVNAGAVGQSRDAKRAGDAGTGTIRPPWGGTSCMYRSFVDSPYALFAFLVPRIYWYAFSRLLRSQVIANPMSSALHAL